MSKKNPILRGANLKAAEGDLSIEIKVSIVSNDGLQVSEVEDIQKTLTRGIARVIEDCRYCDFGIESIDVRW